MEQYRIFVISRLLGLFPFSTAGKFSFVQSIYSITLIVLIIFMYVTSFSYFYVSSLVSFSPGPLLSSVDIFQGLTSLLGYIVHYSLVIKNRYDFSNLIKFFGQIKSKKSYEFYVLSIGMIMLALSSMVSMEGKCHSVICVLMVSIDLGLLVQFLIMLQFLTFVQFLKYEFTAIKNSIDIDRHEQLVTVGGLINSLYGWQLLIFLLNFVASFILAALNLLGELHQYTATRDLRPSTIIAANIMMVFHLMELIYMCDVCSSTCCEVRKSIDEKESNLQIS